jgi:hypothetical protein
MSMYRWVIAQQLHREGLTREFKAKCSVV